MFHLEEAARLGNPYALLDLAESQDDPSYLEAAAAQGVIAEPKRLAELAQRFGRDDVAHWLTVAAERGDIDAMRQLIEGFDAADLRRCWTWVYFAELLGTDLTKSHMRAYHDGGEHDGEEYDDDFGGPLYVAGEEGVELDGLETQSDLMARDAAERLFRDLPKKFVRAAA